MQQKKTILDERAIFLKTGRERLKLSRVKLAQMLNIDPKTVERWEKGTSKMRDAEFLRLQIFFAQ